VARQAQIDAAFSTLEQVNHRFSTILRFTASDLEAEGVGFILPEKVHSEWQSLKSGWQQLNAERSEVQHEHIIAAVMAMISRVDNTSNLRLDPALDSAHLLVMNFEVATPAQFHINQIGEH